MENKPVYTIGHGNRKIEDFIKLLKEFKVQYLIDIRSQPYSKFNPQFNQNDLKYFLDRYDMTYIFMGDTLGGRPTDPTCYNNEGKVDYEKIKKKDFFLKGIERLKSAYKKDVSIVVMCSESNPCECHRSKLIGRVLSTEQILLRHIDEKGRLKTQADVINELNKGLSDTTLFSDEITINTTSRKFYT